MGKNAIIKSVDISNDDHGCLTIWVSLDYGGSGQGFGGYNCYSPSLFKAGEYSDVAGHYLWRVMEIAGVHHWKDVVGKTVRVRSVNTVVSAIGHIVNEDWFCPSEDFR